MISLTNGKYFEYLWIWQINHYMYDKILRPLRIYKNYVKFGGSHKLMVYFLIAKTVDNYKG